MEPVYEMGGSYPRAFIRDEVREPDPELERLIREEEEIEEAIKITGQVEDIQRFEQYRESLRKKYGA